MKSKRMPMRDLGLPVRRLMETHAALQFQQAIYSTAERFGISEREVLEAVKSDRFPVKYVTQTRR